MKEAGRECEKETFLGLLDLYLFTYKIFLLLCRCHKDFKNENTAGEGVVAEIGNNHTLVIHILGSKKEWEEHINGEPWDSRKSRERKSKIFRS